MSYTHGETIRFRHPHMGNASGRYAGTLTQTGELLLGTDAGQIIIKSEWVISDSPLSAANDTYTLIVERVTPRDNEVSATEIVTSGNVYQAMQVAYTLARPSKGDVLILTWVNHAGDKRELSTKVLDFK